VLDGRPTTAQGLLLLGKPVLMLPTQLEGQMLSRRVQALGAGLWLDAEGDALPATADLVRALQRLADDGVLADTASAWARQHASHSDERTLAAVLARCDTLLSAR
jgi:UDP:flavonoid glycosyltransferase YjiC (YdhE family)